MFNWLKALFRREKVFCCDCGHRGDIILEYDIRVLLFSKAVEMDYPCSCNGFHPCSWHNPDGRCRKYEAKNIEIDTKERE